MLYFLYGYDDPHMHYVLTDAILSRRSSDQGRAEIAAVETVTDLPVHQEQLAVRDQTAARPNGQWSPTTVVIEGISHGDAVDGGRGAVAAHALPRKRRDVLHEIGRESCRERVCQYV